MTSSTGNRIASPARQRPYRTDSLETLHWLYSVEQRSAIPIKWLVLLFAVSLILIEDRKLLEGYKVPAVLGGYTLCNILFTWLFLGRKIRVARFRRWSLVSLATDVLFVSLLILYTGGLQSELYFLIFLPILRSAALFQDPFKKLWCDILITFVYVLCAIAATQAKETESIALLALRVTLIWGVILTSSFLVQVLTSQQARIFAINERLRFQSEQNREILSGMTDAVLVFDPSQQLIICNRSAEELLGRLLGIRTLTDRKPFDQGRWQFYWMEPPRVFGDHRQTPWEGSDSDIKFWSNLTPDQIATPLERLLDEVRFRPDQRINGIPITLVERSEKRRSLIASVAAIGETPDARLGWMVLLRDISEYQALEAQLLTSEKLAAVGRLAAGLAHELGNPLGIIKSCANYLKRKVEPDSDLIEEAEVLASEAERCERILRQLLAFASQEQPHLNEIDLRELLEKSVNLVAYQTPESVSLAVSSDKELAPCYTDPDLLTQAFVNLLLNSVQAIEREGKVEVSLEQAPLDSWCIQIRDNGCGMGRETLSRIYDPFYTTKPTGTGLGLAITQRIIQRLDGVISVKSEHGHGTEFTIILPRRVETYDSELVVG
jgi:signal transduction histidine kinase